MPLRKVIGLHSCREALKERKPQELKALYIKQNWKESPILKNIVNLAESKGLKPKVTSEKQFRRFLNVGHAHSGKGDFQSFLHQGLVLEVEHQFEEISFDKETATVLILDHIQDPRNLGAILRTAWLMSVSCVFLSSGKSASLSPFVTKSASGSVEHIPVFRKDNLKTLIKDLKKHSFWVYALSPYGKKLAWEENLKGKKAFVLGGEQAGLRPSIEKECDELLFIPQKESSASYNVSVVTGMILYENHRQNNKCSPDK